MNYKYLELLENFTEENLPSLPEVTLGALELFDLKGLPKLDLSKHKKPLVVGSGNAISTAKILFEGVQATFANESDYLDKMKLDIDSIYIFSASGGKHAPIVAKAAKKKKLPTYLITCTKGSQAEKVVGEKNTTVTIKNREPYTYNTSTYLGWILSKTQEDPRKILNFIEKKVDPVIPNCLSNFKGFLLVTKDEFLNVNPLFEVKFIELFGRTFGKDVKTTEEIKHAITVVPAKGELCINFTTEKIDYKGKDLKIPIPKNAKIGAMMAIGYYVIGKIQEQNEQYFKDNIKAYIKRNAKGSFGKAISTIVE